MQDCIEKFEAIDQDKSGQLESQELYPVILELAEEHPLAIGEEHCERLLEIFDKDGNGVLEMHEFIDFVKFIFTMSYLEQNAIS